jgi:sugar lactone lactonase YvrE
VKNQKIVAVCFFVLAVFFCSQAQIITTVVGNGSRGYSGNGGLALTAQLYFPRTVDFDAAGNMYIGDECELRKVNSSGIITAVTGKPACGYSGDNGPDTAAQVNIVVGTAFDMAGNIYFTDSQNSAIRRINNAGVISTFSLLGQLGLGIDGSSNLYSCTVDGIYIITPSATYSLFAGNGTMGYSGDNGPANMAQLGIPHGVAFDRKGNLYIADTYNYRIRKVDSSGIITTVCGTGTAGYNGDNILAATAQIGGACGMVCDDYNNLYFADQSNGRVRKIDTNGIITTVAGNGVNGFSGDNNLATLAQLDHPSDVAIYGNDLYIADGYNYRIRKIDNVTSVPPVQTTAFETSVYPNPASKTLCVKTTGNVDELQIIITDLFGNELKNERLTPEQTSFDISAFPSGIYFVHVKNKSGVLIQKLVVQQGGA